MKKFMYDRMVQEYSKCSKEELIQEIMALSEIETSDRVFANEVFAGTTAADINSMFSIIDELNHKFSYRKADQLKEATIKAQSAWRFITSQLMDMNNNGRAPEALSNFRKRVDNAKDKDDSI